RPSGRGNRPATDVATYRRAWTCFLLVLTWLNVLLLYEPGVHCLGDRQDLCYLPWAYGDVVFAEGRRAFQARFEFLFGGPGDTDSVWVVARQPLDRGMLTLPVHAQSALQDNLHATQ